MKLLNKLGGKVIALFVAPVVLLLVAVTVQGLLLRSFPQGLTRAAASALLGIFISVVLGKGISDLARRFQIPAPVLGTMQGLLVGILVGVAATAMSGFLFRFAHGFGPDLSNFFAGLQLRLLGNLFPALTEEAVFRFGIVNSAASLAGSASGLMAGSLPFGLIHLFSRLFGSDVGFMHVLGVTAAGLLLSILYLRSGLTAAIGCHWIWNSFCIQWVTAYHLGNQGVVEFEGALTTTVVLVLLCCLIEGWYRLSCVLKPSMEAGF